MYPARLRPEYDYHAPTVSWPQAMAYLRSNFRQGDHVSILGPTGTGKTHIALELAEIRTYVLVIACKQKDPLIEDTLQRGYHLIPGNDLRKGIEYVDGRPRHKKLVYWPRLPEGVASKLPEHERIRARSRLQRPLIAGALGYVDLDGHWCVVLDEGTWVARDLGLQKEIDAALMQWRTNKASIIFLSQRPAWVGRYVLSMPKFVFLFNTPNADDAKSLGDITGANARTVREIVSNLDRRAHEALMINTETGEMFRTVATAR